jgi:nitrite reductase/ring-hydroxylating ferredoxin subunit
MFNSEGWAVPKAVRVFGGDGDMIIFNGDMMHSSICNTSDDTRVAITCRINAVEPIFIKEAYWWIQRWVPSIAIESGSMEVCAYTDPVAVPCADRPGSTPVRGRVPDLMVDGDLSRETPTRVLPKATLPLGAKLLVKFRNGQLVIGRAWSGALFAITPKCPHLGISLADGSIGDDGRITCPGHGLRFSLSDGSEACTDRYRILAYDAFEDGEWISVQLRRK